MVVINFPVLFILCLQYFVVHTVPKTYQVLQYLWFHSTEPSKFTLPQLFQPSFTVTNHLITNFYYSWYAISPIVLHVCNSYHYQDWTRPCPNQIKCSTSIKVLKSNCISYQNYIQNIHINYYYLQFIFWFVQTFPVVGAPWETIASHCHSCATLKSLWSVHSVNITLC